MNKLSNKLASIGTVLRILVTKPKLLRKLLSFTYKGYLLKVGWINSVRTKRPVDADGEPLPWLTYPMIDLLQERLPATASVFEFGGGNSTLYFSRRVHEVTTVEHNQQWFEYLKSQAPQNCNVVFQTLEYDGSYSRTAQATGRKFDIVVVDGRDRVNCARYAVDSLSDSGVIIFDDFERERYQEAAKMLAERGFKQYNFWGMKPGLIDGANTALFYRAGNLFGL